MKTKLTLDPEKPVLYAHFHSHGACFYTEAGGKPQGTSLAPRSRSQRRKVATPSRSEASAELAAYQARSGRAQAPLNGLSLAWPEAKA